VNVTAKKEGVEGELRDDDDKVAVLEKPQKIKEGGDPKFSLGIGSIKVKKERLQNFVN
jgi:hypothetical protein